MDLCLLVVSRASSHIQDTELPTRVIDCGTPGTDPRLIQTQGMKGQYIALSHCWGGVKPPITTAHNLESRMLCIPYSTLPRTFRDAVDVVRELGFQFVWIDGFCIIQGDEDDWKHESALMGRYFSRSALTITGPAAKDAFAGFLHHSCPSPLGTNRALLFKFDKDATMNALVGFGVEQYPFALSYPEPGAVAKRAWVVQERLLSPRVLYFGADQAYFECNTAMNFETLKYPVKRGAAYPRGETGWRVPKNALQEANLVTWYLIMDTFGLCSLTEGKDKLASVSGVAASFLLSLSTTFT